MFDNFVIIKKSIYCSKYQSTQLLLYVTVQLHSS